MGDGEVREDGIVPDVAGPRPEAEPPRASQGVDANAGIDANGPGLQTGQEAPEGVAEPDEVDDPDADDPGRLLLRMEEQWQGDLPSPKDFGAYPEPVQRKMVEWRDERLRISIELAKAQSEIDRLNAEHVREMESAQSARQDEITRMESRQIPIAQVGTILIDFLLVIAIIVAILSGQVTAVGAIALAFGGVNVANLVFQRRRGGR